MLFGLFAACAAVPAGGFWLAFGDAKLAGSTVAAGLSIACCSFPLLLTHLLRLPLDRLPARAEPGATPDPAGM